MNRHKKLCEPVRTGGKIYVNRCEPKTYPCERRLKKNTWTGVNRQKIFCEPVWTGARKYVNRCEPWFALTESLVVSTCSTSNDPSSSEWKTKECLGIIFRNTFHKFGKRIWVKCFEMLKLWPKFYTFFLKKNIDKNTFFTLLEVSFCLYPECNHSLF